VEDEDIAKMAVRRGAHEYLLQGSLDAYLLPKAVGSMIERAANTEALFGEKERAQVTLNSIGDAVVSTDASGRVTYLNIVAENLVGWSQQRLKVVRSRMCFGSLTALLAKQHATRWHSLFGKIKP
jgi:PAS domain-containing protein